MAMRMRSLVFMLKEEYLMPKSRTIFVGYGGLAHVPGCGHEETLAGFNGSPRKSPIA
jgi:hypothetical protein